MRRALLREILGFEYTSPRGTVVDGPMTSSLAWILSRNARAPMRNGLDRAAPSMSRVSTSGESRADPGYFPQYVEAAAARQLQLQHCNIRQSLA